MKLRNKKDGAIYKIEDIDLGTNEDGIWLGMNKYNSLAELCEEWEDVPEPKGYWHIVSMCAGVQYKEDTNNGEDSFNKEIGNKFETEEEAEKAVEKLKAWKRLKDKGLRIKLRHFGHNATLEANWDVLEGDYRDLVTVFWSEE